MVSTATTWWDSVGTAPTGKTGDERLASLGLDWKVSKGPLFTYGLGDKSNFLLPVPGRMAALRSDTSAVIATVGETYKVIQNSVLADLSDALLEVEGGVQFIKGGELNGGRIVYLVAKLPDGIFKIEGDDSPIERFLILRTGHDGLTSLTLGPTAIRLFCTNQVNSTIRGLKSKIVIRHTVNSDRPIAEMRRALNFTGEYFDGLQKVFVELTKRPMTIDDVVKATEKLIPSTAQEPERALKAQAQRDLILGLYRNADDLRDLPETSYRFYQAVSAYADHERTYRKTKRGTAEDARAVAILQGTALGIKDRALALVLPPTARRAAGGRFVSSQVPVSNN